MKAYRTTIMYDEKMIAAEVDPVEGTLLRIGKVRVHLPDGCIGVQFIFKTKKAIRKFEGKNSIFQEIAIGKGE